ncbi:hypothetical protein HY345_01225 [Candidatus Microgenomates bacterium]|nr:hypothetical protein [Candidatus Microgenomates bacterium]
MGNKFEKDHTAKGTVEKGRVVNGGLLKRLRQFNPDVWTREKREMVEKGVIVYFDQSGKRILGYRTGAWELVGKRGPKHITFATSRGRPQTSIRNLVWNDHLDTADKGIGMGNQAHRIIR